MIKKHILFGFFVLVLSCNAFAQDYISAEADKKTMTTDEFLIYKVKVDLSDKKTLAPQIPEFKDFYIISQLQSSSIQFAQAKVKNSATYEFILRPVKTGELEIEPATIKIKGKVYSTEAFKVLVRQGKAKFQPEPESNKKQSPLPGILPESEQTVL